MERWKMKRWRKKTERKQRRQKILSDRRSKKPWWKHREHECEEVETYCIEQKS